MFASIAHHRVHDAFFCHPIHRQKLIRIQPAVPVLSEKSEGATLRSKLLEKFASISWCLTSLVANIEVVGVTPQLMPTIDSTSIERVHGTAMALLRALLTVPYCHEGHANVMAMPWHIPPHVPWHRNGPPQLHLAMDCRVCNGVIYLPPCIATALATTTLP